MYHFICIDILGVVLMVCRLYIDRQHSVYN